MSDSPKKVIGIDSSSLSGVVVAFEMHSSSFRVVTRSNLSLDAGKHSERLLWSIDTVLRDAGWTLDQLSYIAVGVGPGSFTGLRIGLTTARILAKSIGIKLVPFSSLALLARSALEQLETPNTNKNQWCVVATDAAKGEWFTLMGEVHAILNCINDPEQGAPHTWDVGVTEEVLAQTEVLRRVRERLESNPHEKWLAIGSAFQKHPALFETIMDLPERSPVVLAKMAHEAILKGQERESSQIHPRYLRASDAEVKLKSGLLKPSPVSVKS